MVNLSNGHILLSPPLPTPLQHQSACKGIATLSAHYPHDSPTICERYSFAIFRLTCRKLAEGGGMSSGSICGYNFG